MLRYVGGKGEGEGRKGYLSGYGVFLDLKKMDYLALDDRNSHGGTYTPLLSVPLLLNRAALQIQTQLKVKNLRRQKRKRNT